MARVDDIPGIKQVIRPLEESGALIPRSNEEVCKFYCCVFLID